MAKWDLSSMGKEMPFDYWELQWLIGLAHAYMDEHGES